MERIFSRRKIVEVKCCGDDLRREQEHVLIIKSSPILERTTLPEAKGKHLTIRSDRLENFGRKTIL